MMKQGDMKLQGIDPLDAIVVRLGRKRCDVYNREFTTDITRYMDVAMKILKEN